MIETLGTVQVYYKNVVKTYLEFIRNHDSINFILKWNEFRVCHKIFTIFIYVIAAQLIGF